ncbi:hypothetical protein ABIC83_002397 [Roseateles asaccharophilus]|uniref:DUF262 domain-containing protein n=1 Tax=Roseateles asaccharophilus TaxID=582607 RepID=UPI0038363E96
MASSHKPADLSDEYWASLSPAHRALYELVRPQPRSVYAIDMRLSGIEDFFAKLGKDMAAMGGVLELDPDFQRGHVWEHHQRERYVEALIRANAPRTIKFNCPGWQSRGDAAGDIKPFTFQCIDGLQRLTSVRMYMAGDVKVFGGLTVTDLENSPFDPRRIHLQIEVYEFRWREQLLQYYLDLNEGGSVHTTAELDRVRALLEAAKAPEQTAAKGAKPGRAAKNY